MPERDQLDILEVSPRPSSISREIRRPDNEGINEREVSTVRILVHGQPGAVIRVCFVRQRLRMSFDELAQSNRGSR